MNWLQKISAGYYSLDAYYNGYWVDPAGKIFEMEDTHHSWIHYNHELLLDEYGIDMEEWMLERQMESEREQYDDLREEMIRDIAFEREIDESQVMLTDEQEQQLSDYAAESAEAPNDLETVDYLISLGWIRISQKMGYIHIEAREDLPGFWDKAEMALIELFPKIWSNPRYDIVVNDQGVTSEQVQDTGSLRNAIDNLATYNNRYLYQR